MIANVLSKLIAGVLSDHLGALKATVILIVMNIIGIFLLMVDNSAYGVALVCTPLLTTYFFGKDNYDNVYPKISFATNTGTAISLSMVGYIYDFFGSYIYAFLLALMLIGICIVILIITSKLKYV